MKIGVLRSAGADRHDDAHLISTLLERSDTSEVRSARGIAKLDVLIVPEYVAGLAAAVLQGLDAFAAGGGAVLGSCGGFRLLCERGLIDGQVHAATAEAGEVFCVVEGRPTPFTHAIPAGRHLPAISSCRVGHFEHPDPERLGEEGRVVLRYCSADGEVEPAANPDGSTANIAGVCNREGNVVGILPHAPPSFLDCVAAWSVGTPARV